MTIGMLWFDNSKDTLIKKIRRAAEYYQKKYGSNPKICYIHPTMLNGEKYDGMTIIPSRQVLPNHFWLGNEERL